MEFCAGETEDGKPCTCTFTQDQLQTMDIGYGTTCPEENCKHVFSYHYRGS
jgi:hypothetical protein